MSANPLCDEPEVDPCPPKFRLQASAWIDARNFGRAPIETDPTAGIRLRWTCPFWSIPVAQRVGWPERYIVERSGPLSAETLRSFTPSVGHDSRSPTPMYLWRELERHDALNFRAAGKDCQGVDAVAFKVPADGAPGTVTLIDTDGMAQIVAELAPGDDFHFEWADIKLVSFSAAMGVNEVVGFVSDGSLDYSFQFQSIAEINAAAWDRLELAVAAQRVTNPAGEPFLSIDAPEWDELCALGRAIGDAFDQGCDAIESAAGLSLMTATRFEAAALIGLGFVDGGHAPNLTLDRLSGPFLTRPDEQVYAYRIIAHLRTAEGGQVERRSNCAFSYAHLAPPLAPVVCRFVSTPSIKAELLNSVRPGPSPQQPQVFAKPSMRVTCHGRWELTSELPTIACVATRPVAQDSVITGDRFADAGTFLTGLNSGPRLVRGHSLIERREHSFDVPYFDSDVGCEAEGLDLWDRSSAASPPLLVQPDVDYDGVPPPLKTALCRAPAAGKPGEVALMLDAAAAWLADPLAARSRAKIHLLMRNPAHSPAVADVEIGPASPAAGGHWSASLRSSLAQGEIDQFVGGTLAVASLTARIVAMGPVHGGIARCTFEVSTSCAGADLYRCPAGWIAANLAEDLQASRLWIDLPDKVAVLETGEPARHEITTALPPLEASATLYFATRLAFSFEGEDYVSPIGLPVPAPYIHSPPPPPSACMTSRQLASDFYGRVFVRTEASRCHPLDPGHATRVAVAAGELVTVDAFQKERSEGLFGPQSSLDGVLFEAFSRLAQVTEGDRFTVGVANHRVADNRDSLPARHSERLRRIE
jgi:hypothetical protein